MFDQATIAALQNNYNASQAAQPKQNTNSHGNFLTHLIPSIGGTAGGVGGAAIGTALLPGIGTLAGALIGGALGGGAGKVVENKQEGQGAFNGVASQALENGVLSAGPLRLLKGAGALAKAAPELKAGTTTLMDALTNAGAKATGSRAAQNLITQGEQAMGRTAGISAGTKDVGAQFGRLGTQDTSKMLQTLQGEGIKSTGNANNLARDIQNKLTQYGKQISGHFANNNTQYTPAEVKQLADEFLNNVTLGGMKTSDQGVLNEAQTLANDLKNNVTDKQSLWKFRQSLDNRLPDAKQATDTNLAKTQAATKSLRQFIAGKLGEVPGMKNYSDLSNIQQHVLEEANRANNASGGIVGRIAASGPVQKAEATAGKAAMKAGQAIANPYSIPQVAARTMPLQALQAAGDSMQAAQNPNMAMTANMMNTQSNSANMPGNLPQNGGMSSNASPYGQENLMYDIARDPRNADKYISLYTALDKVFNPQGSTVKPNNQQLGLANQGMNALQQMYQMIQQDPSVVAKNATPGQSLPLVGGLITNASGAGLYHSLADSAMQSLLHLQTGAAASKEEIAQAKGQLPQPGDPPAVVQQKLQNLASAFNDFSTGQQSMGGATAPAATQTTNPADLMSALQALGY